MYKNLLNQRKTLQFFLKISSLKEIRSVFLLMLLISSGQVGYGQVTVTSTAGNGTGNGTHATLGAAFTALGTAATGVITITITADTSEAASGATLGAGPWTSITIKPSGVRTISGAITAGNPIISFNGADNVTIDGLNTGGNSLTISNTTASNTTKTSTITFITDATNNKITNTTILGSSLGTLGASTGTIFFSTAASSGSGNDNNEISYCNIGPATLAGVTTLPTKSIYGNGSTTSTAIGNSGNIIKYNNIYDFFGGALDSAGISLNSGNNTWTIQNNNFYQTAQRAWTLNSKLNIPIHINSVTATSGNQGHTITYNKIGYSSNSQTGTYSLTGNYTGKFIGIYYSGIVGGTSSTISNNTIASIAMDNVGSNGTSVASGSPFMGIFVLNGPTTVNNNTIGSLSETGSLVFNTQGAGSTLTAGIYNNGLTDNFTANNNSIGGFIGSNSGAYKVDFYGITSNTTGTNTIQNNTIGGSGVTNSIQSTTTTVGVVYGINNISGVGTISGNTIQNLNSVGNVYGIYNTNTTNCTINTNSINNLTSAGASSILAGIYNTVGATVAISGNTINTLTGSGTTSPQAFGAYILGGTTVNFFNNKIFGISESGSISTTSPAVSGLYIRNSTAVASTVNAYNNLIGGLTAPSSNLNDAIYGVFAGSGSSTASINTTYNLYHNTVNLSGTSSGANFGTSGIYHTANATSTTGNLNLRNNIVVNNCTPSGTGISSAFNRSSGVATMLANYASTSNNNLFYAGTPSATNLIYTDGVSTAQTIAVYKSGVFTAGTIATRDNLSITENPTFVSTTGSDATYLHIDTSTYTGTNAGGGFISSVTTDYDGVTRNTSTPDIGADEFNTTNCLAPQATSLSLTQSGTNINGTFSNSVPFANGYLIVRTDGNTAPSPADGTSYAADSTDLGSGTYVVASGSSTTFVSSSLTSGNTYYYWVFSYGNQCSTNPIYNTTSPLTGNAVAPTPCSTPTNQPTALVLSTTSGSTISGSFTVAASTPSGYLVVRSTSNTEPTLTNGTLYTVGSTALGATTYVESVGTGITFSSTGLNPAITYYYYIFSYNSACTGEPFYLTSASSSPVVALTGSATTLSCITTGTYTIGATGNYSSITNAINTLKATTCGITGPVVFEFKSDYDSSGEVYPIVIPEIPGSIATNTVTFRPGAGVATSITGAGIVTGALIYIAGKNIIIDGSNNGTSSRNLTITNSNGSSNVMIIGNAGTSTATALTNVTLKNTILINGGYTYSAIVISSNSGAAGYFNDITIQNNSIRNALNGISANATAATGNGSGLLITSNDINGSGANAVVKYGIQITGVDGVTVSNNNIANITSSTEFIRGIYFLTGTNSGSITGNSISSLSSTGTGGGNGLNGIQTSSTTATAIEISNNTISGLSVAGTTGVSGISSSSPFVTIKNNKISDIKSTTASSGARGIYLSTLAAYTGDSNIYNNVIFDVAAYGTSNPIDNSYGIYVTGGAKNNIYYNTINMNTNQTSTAANNPSAALYIASGATANSLNVKNNIFANTQSGGNPVENRYAIFSSSSANNIFSSIDNNDYYTTGTNLGYIGSARATLSNIVTGFGGNVNSVNVLPSFTSATNLLPTSGSDLIGMSISGITTDFAGTTRLSPPSMGAYEVTIPGIWSETAASSVWESNSNWRDGTAPTSGTTIYIPSVSTNMPLLGTSPTINRLLNNGALTLGSTILTINGAITGSGTLTGSASSSLVIGGTAGTLNFDQTTLGTTNVLKNLTISTGSATLGNALNITAGISSGTVTVGTSATLATGGFLTLKSDANGTARVGITAGAITGNVTVERYIPFGKRAFRFLTPSVTTTSSIYNNWQIGGATTAGRGTHITGSTTGANGFDITASGSASMYTYQNNVDVSTTGWLAIPDTDVTTLTAGMGYRTLVRGDRNVDISVASADNMNFATTLSATGTLKVGDVVFDSTSTTTPALLNTTSNTITNGYSLIGNPYASPVDWELVSRTNVDDYYYAWDPNMGTPAERGRYVAYNASTGLATYNGTDNNITYVSKYIQPGQAIFVKTIGASPSLTFEEADKASTFTNVFRTRSNSTLSVAVYNPSEVAFASPIDATIAVFGTDFDASVGLGDIEKLYSSGEHLAWSRGAKLLAMDATSPVVTNDELLLKTMQFSANKSYTFKVHATNFDTSLTGYLVDQYLSSQTQLDFSTSNFITFATTADAASYGANRFKVVFNTSALNNEEWSSKSLRIYPNPVLDNQFSIAVSPSITDKVAITIYNMIGQSVYYESATAINNSIVVRPSAILKAGVYMVQMVNNGKTSTQKIIIK